ncbi:MAG: hypothetical protein ACTJLL_01805 [Anaplasma sp.]
MEKLEQSSTPPKPLEHGHMSRSTNRGAFAKIEQEFNYSSNIQSEQLERLQIKMTVHSVEPLEHATQQYINNATQRTLREFDEQFTLSPNTTPKEIQMYVFEHKRDFDAALKKVGIEGSLGGIAWPTTGEVYVYKVGKNRIENLAHELSHCLFDYAVAGHYGQHLGVKIINEGVGDYIQHLVEHGPTVVDMSFRQRVDQVLEMLKQTSGSAPTIDLDAIAGAIAVHGQRDHRYTQLPYDLGMVYVHYMQQHTPALFRESLKDAAILPTKMHAIHGDPLAPLLKIPMADFHKWLEEHSTAQFVKDYDALFVVMDHQIGFDTQVLDGKAENVKIFSAHLEDKTGKVVHNLSPVEHIATNDVIVALNPYSRDQLEIQRDSHFLKSVVTDDGVTKYVYCDAQGEEYYLSKRPENVTNIAKIMAKYDSPAAEIQSAVLGTRAAYHEYAGDQNAQTEQAVYALLERASTLLKNGLDGISIPHLDFATIAGTELENKYLDLYTRVVMLQSVYAEYISKRAQSMMQGLEDSETSHMIGRILKHAVYIDPVRLRGLNQSQLEELQQNSGTILALRAEGKGDISGVSVYLPDGRKVAELPSDAEVFMQRQLDGGVELKNFAAADGLKAVHTMYSRAPVAVVQLDEHGNKVSHFVHDAKSPPEDGDLVVGINRFLDPQVLELSGRQSDIQTTKGVKIESNEYVPSENAFGAFARKGQIVDDRGTERTSDDTHTATVYSGNEVVIQKLSSLQFYMSEEGKDASGNVVNKPAFFIRDVAAGKVLQFPDSITHLKLVRTESGATRLVPCTEDGDVNPQGMPHNMEGYAYIDPIFVYNRLKADWISKHATLDLVDFSGYANGTLFKLRWNADDPSIPKNAAGEVTRIEGQSYFTRAELLYEPENLKIGELSSSPSFFQDKIFISFDHNYSHSDFVSSLHEQEVTLQDNGDGTQRVGLTGKGDLGSDRGYSDYYSLNHRTEEDSPELAREVQKLADASSTDSLRAKRSVVSPNAAELLPDAKPTRLIEVGEDELHSLKSTMIYTRPGESVVNGQTIPSNDLFIYNPQDGYYFQFPKAITHLKVVTHNGQKQLVPSTADGSEDPAGMPENLGEHRYIGSIMLHSDAVTDRTDGAESTSISLADLGRYKDGTLLEIRSSGDISYAKLGGNEDLHVKIVHLFDSQGAEVGVLSKYPYLLRGDVSVYAQESAADSHPVDYAARAIDSHASSGTYFQHDNDANDTVNIVPGWRAPTNCDYQGLANSAHFEAATKPYNMQDDAGFRDRQVDKQNQSYDEYHSTVTNDQGVATSGGPDLFAL